MRHRQKTAFGSATYFPGGRIREVQFGVLLFQLQQPLKQFVIVTVGNFRIIQNVIPLVMVFDLFFQGINFFSDVFHC